MWISGGRFFLLRIMPNRQPYLNRHGGFADRWELDPPNSFNLHWQLFKNNYQVLRMECENRIDGLRQANKFIKEHYESRLDPEF
jgi:regulatory protein YycH of two-component signal transduction system YycFG